jgi:hypothetical protein
MPTPLVRLLFEARKQFSVVGSQYPVSDNEPIQNCSGTLNLDYIGDSLDGGRHPIQVLHVEHFDC